MNHSLKGVAKWVSGWKWQYKQRGLKWPQMARKAIVAIGGNSICNSSIDIVNGSFTWWDLNFILAQDHQTNNTFFANFTIGWQPIPRVWPNYCILRRSMTGSPVNCDNRRMKEKKASRQEIGQISAQKRCGFSCPGSWLLYTYTWPLSGPFLPPMADHMVNHHMTDFSPKYEKSRGRRFVLFHITLLNSWR